MLAITCDKCRRRYTAMDEELRVYLQQVEGKKYAQVLCPHCGKPSKVPADRIHQALRFSPPAEVQTLAPEETAASSATPVLGGPTGFDEIANASSLPEEENPPA